MWLAQLILVNAVSEAERERERVSERTSASGRLCLVAYIIDQSPTRFNSLQRRSLTRTAIDDRTEIIHY